MAKKPEKLERFGVSMEQGLLDQLDAFIKRKGYPNRSEALRDFVRANLVEESWADDKKEVVGTVTLIYNHHSLELPKKLTDLQHHYHQEILSTTHFHLDAHNCLEVLALRGQAKKVREVADRLISAKGVKHGRLVMTATGAAL
jgi:CopG family nickel-responsive transcriptional regulator